jgi:hypothetical protein
MLKKTVLKVQYKPRELPKEQMQAAVRLGMSVNLSVSDSFTFALQYLNGIV